MRLLPVLLLAGSAAAVQAAGSLDSPDSAAAFAPLHAPLVKKRQVLPLPPPLRDETADPPPPSTAAPSAPVDAAPPAAGQQPDSTPPDQPAALPENNTPAAGQPAAPNNPPPQAPDLPSKSSNAGSQQRANPADPAPNPGSRPSARTGDAATPDSQSTKQAKANLGRGNSTSTAKAPTPSPTTAPAEESQDSGSNTGVVLGGVLGGLAALVVLLALGYRWKSAADRNRKTAADATESKLSPEFKLKPQPADAGFVPVSPRPRGSLTPLMHGSTGTSPTPSSVPPSNAFGSYGNGAVPSPPNSGVLAPLRVMNSTEQGLRPPEEDELGYSSGYPPPVPGPRPYPSPLSNGYNGNTSMGLQAPSSGDVYSYAFPDRPRPQDTLTQQQNPEVYRNRAQPPMSSPAYGNPRTGPFQQHQQPYQSAGRGSYATQGRMGPNYPGAPPMSQGTPYNRDQQGW